MPGRLFMIDPITTVAKDLGVSVGDFEDLPPRRNIAPGDQICVLTSDGFTLMRWGIIPVGRKNARGRPVMETIINARSETVFDKSAFQGTRRAVVPVSGWYEWTGDRGRKVAWEISSKDGKPLFFAAIADIWMAPGGMEVPQVATVTCRPNSDLAEIHHRMAVILSFDSIPNWLTGSVEEASPLMKPWPDGQLQISRVTDDL